MINFFSIFRADENFFTYLFFNRHTAVSNSVSDINDFATGGRKPDVPARSRPARAVFAYDNNAPTPLRLGLRKITDRMSE
jgi:hypothetical protein